MLDFYKHLNSTFKNKEVLFIIFDSFEHGIKWLSLAMAWLSLLFDYFVLFYLVCCKTIFT